MAERVRTGLILGVVLLLAFDALAVRLGIAPGVLPTFEGGSLVALSRALGVTALLALTLSALFGLLVSTRLCAHWVSPRGAVDVHRWLSSAALGLTALHALVLLLDGTVHFDLLDALVPFLSSWKPLAVGLGVLAAWGAATVHASDSWRDRIGGRAWRKLHYLSFAVFVAAILHGLLAGSAEGPAWVRLLYAACAISVSALGVVRAGHHFRRRAAGATP